MGSYRTTAALDYRVVDGTETIAFTATRGATTTALTVTCADPQVYTLRDVAGAGGHLAVGDRRWVLGADQITGGLIPTRGDTIVDTDGATWKLLDGAALDELRVTWICPARRSR